MLKKVFWLFFITFLITPLNLGAVTVMNPRRDIHVSPGGVAQTVIKVINESRIDQTLKVYPSDYLHYADGKSGYPEPGTTPRSNANWISFKPDFFTIKPGMIIDVVVEIRPPATTLEGSYWCMLMFEFIDDRRELRKASGEMISGATMIRRQGVHLRSHITGTGTMQAKMHNKRIEMIGDKRFLHVDMENTGTLFYRGDFWVEIFNNEGYPIGRVQSMPRGIYPGCSIRLQADITHLKKGSYKVLCVFDTREQKVFGARYDIKIP